VRTRRILVVAVLAICAFLAAYPGSLHGAGIAAALALAAGDAALVRATGGLAFARTRSLDERQAALRDLAYRRGFRLLGLAIVLVIVLGYASDVAGFFLMARGPAGVNQLDTGLAARFLVAGLELLVMMPTLVIAWSQREPADDDPAPAAQRPLGAPALAVPAILAAWLAAVAWAPVQTAAPSAGTSIGADSPGSVCRHFAAGHTYGAGFGATVGMRVEVCWNGRQAFVDPDPDRMVTACGADDVQDFAVVSGVRCDATVDGTGTLHYTVRARVSPLPLSIGARDVILRLAVTRDGAVLERP